jgi:hypothetical protein
MGIILTILKKSLVADDGLVVLFTATAGLVLAQVMDRSTVEWINGIIAGVIP